MRVETNLIDMRREQVRERMHAVKDEIKELNRWKREHDGSTTEYDRVVERCWALHREFSKLLQFNQHNQEEDIEL